MPPAAVLGVALAAAAIGAGIQVAGNIQQAKAAKASAEFNAKVAENEAVRVEQERSEDNRRLRIRNRRLQATQRVLTAKGGVTEAGSPLEIMAETAGELELDVLDLNRARFAKVQQLKGVAEITRFEGRARATGFKLAAAGAGVAGVRRGASIIGT